MAKLEMNLATKFLFVMACLVVMLAGIKAATPILIPFLLALVIAIITNPLVNKFVSYRIPRAVAVLFILTLLVIVGLSLAGVVGQSFNDFSNSMPMYQEKLSNQLVWLVSKLALFDIEINKEQFTEYFNPGVAMSMVGNW
jgi:predicted PurR-regulated permease PerM